MRNFSARDLALYSLLGATLFAAKTAMAALPNIEPVSLLVILLAVSFGWKAMSAVVLFIGLEFCLWGVGPWSLCYLYAWPLLALITYFFRKTDSAFFWAIVSGAFGLLFGLLCSFPYFFIGAASGGMSGGLRAMFAWWIAGIPYDLLHGAGNFALMLALYRPVSSLLRRIPQILAR